MFAISCRTAINLACHCRTIYFLTPLPTHTHTHTRHGMPILSDQAVVPKPIVFSIHEFGSIDVQSFCNRNNQCTREMPFASCKIDNEAKPMMVYLPSENKTAWHNKRPSTLTHTETVLCSLFRLTYFHSSTGSFRLCRDRWQALKPSGIFQFRLICFELIPLHAALIFVSENNYL